MRRLTLTLAVALLLGFVRPQIFPAAAPSAAPAAPGLTGYASAYQEYTKKFQENYMGLGDSLG